MTLIKLYIITFWNIGKYVPPIYQKKMLGKWNPKIKLGTFMVLVAPRGHLEWFFVRDFLSQNLYCDIVVISPVEKINRSYRNISPDVNYFYSGGNI